MSEKAQKLIKRKQALEDEQQPFKTLWQECGDFVQPNKADFTRLYGIGQKRRQQIFDGTPEMANDIFSSSIVGILANPASTWFSFKTLDEGINKVKENAAWLEYASKATLAAINQSNAKFYGNLKSCLLDIGAFGISGMFVQAGQNTRLSFKSYSPAQLLITESADGDVDTVFVPQKMSARQIMQNAETRGWNAHQKVVEAMKTNRPDALFEVIHALYPREEYDGKYRGPLNMKYASCYLDVSNQHIMFESGYMEHPLPTARWDKASNEVYGRSPAMTALADIKTLNASARAMILAAEKNLNPPLQVPSDGTYGNIDLSPAAVNAINMKEGGEIKPILTNGSLPFHQEWEQQKREIIRSAFYVDQLQMVGSANMTATEVIARQDEKLRLMAPSLGRLQGELVGPVVERCLAILVRTGWIAPPPPGLRKTDIKAVYQSPLTRAQRGQEAQTLTGFLTEVSGIAAIDPSVMDNIDLDRATAELHEMRGVSSSILRDPRMVAQLRDQRAQQQQMQQQAAAAQQGVEMAKTANEAGLL